MNSRRFGLIGIVITGTRGGIAGGVAAHGRYVGSIGIVLRRSQRRGH